MERGPPAVQQVRQEQQAAAAVRQICKAGAFIFIVPQTYPERKPAGLPPRVPAQAGEAARPKLSSFYTVIFHFIVNL